MYQPVSQAKPLFDVVIIRNKSSVNQVEQEAKQEVKRSSKRKDQSTLFFQSKVEPSSTNNLNCFHYETINQWFCYRRTPTCYLLCTAVFKNFCPSLSKAWYVCISRLHCKHSSYVGHIDYIVSLLLLHKNALFVCTSYEIFIFSWQFPLFNPISVFTCFLIGLCCCWASSWRNDLLFIASLISDVFFKK